MQNIFPVAKPDLSEGHLKKQPNSEFELVFTSKWTGAVT